MTTQISSLEFTHFPVMLSEIIEISNPKKGGIFIDCTFGGGNYTKALLDLRQKYLLLSTLWYDWEGVSNYDFTNFDAKYGWVSRYVDCYDNSVKHPI